jgi:hypothetical protein
MYCIFVHLVKRWFIELLYKMLPDPPKPSRPILLKTSGRLGPFTAGFTAGLRIKEKKVIVN